MSAGYYMMQAIAASELAALSRLEEMAREAEADHKWLDLTPLNYALAWGEQALAVTRGMIAFDCAPWFAPVAPGPYAVHSVGEAGVVREEVTGLHYPYQALAIAEEMQAVSGLRVVFAVNTDDPEENVERADEAYWVDFPRLCEGNEHRVCFEGCGEFECRKVTA